MSQLILRFKALSYNWRFSIITFFIMDVLGFFSMGLLGAVLYFPVAFLMPITIDDLPGDSVWPTVILIGLLWPFGFLVAAWLWERLSDKITSKAALRMSYTAVLWIWAAALWYMFMTFPLK